MASVQFFKAGTDPAVLEAQVNAELARTPNAVLANWGLAVEGVNIIFDADLEIVSSTLGAGARTLFFKVFGDNQHATAHVQYQAWRGGQPNVNVHNRQLASIGTYTAIAVLYSVGV